MDTYLGKRIALIEEELERLKEVAALERRRAQPMTVVEIAPEAVEGAAAAAYSLHLQEQLEAAEAAAAAEARLMMGDAPEIVEDEQDVEEESILKRETPMPPWLLDTTDCAHLLGIPCQKVYDNFIYHTDKDGKRDNAYQFWHYSARRWCVEVTVFLRKCERYKNPIVNPLDPPLLERLSVYHARGGKLR